MGDDDRISTFSYDGDGEPDSFNLAELQSVVDLYFLTSCKLEKLAEGGYHKVRLAEHGIDDSLLTFL
jgi:hypothetical protein